MALIGLSRLPWGFDAPLEAGGSGGTIAFLSSLKPRETSRWKASSAAPASLRSPSAISSPKRAVSTSRIFSKSLNAPPGAARGARFVGKSCSGIGCSSHRHSPSAGLSAGRPVGPRRNKEKVSRSRRWIVGVGLRATAGVSASNTRAVGFHDASLQRTCRNEKATLVGAPRGKVSCCRA